MFDIKEELKKLPNQPGVYIMHDKNDTIIYIGKAKSLTKRVHQYFQASHNEGLKKKQMVENIHHFEYIVTDSELEALVLECNLIKEHTPKYNTMLRDDKTYPYIKVTTKEAYPRVLFSRQMKKDKAKYYGPYTHGGVKETIDLINKLYMLRYCHERCALFGLRTASTRPFINAPYRATNSHLNLIYKAYLLRICHERCAFFRLRTLSTRPSKRGIFLSLTRKRRRLTQYVVL